MYHTLIIKKKKIKNRMKQVYIYFKEKKADET